MKNSLRYWKNGETLILYGSADTRVKHLLRLQWWKKEAMERGHCQFNHLRTNDWLTFSNPQSKNGKFPKKSIFIAFLSLIETISIPNCPTIFDNRIAIWKRNDWRSMCFSLNSATSSLVGAFAGKVAASNDIGSSLSYHSSSILHFIDIVICHRLVSMCQKEK